MFSFPVHPSFYLGVFFGGLLQTLSSNLSTFSTFLGSGILSAVGCLSLGAQINSCTNTGQTEARFLLPARIFRRMISYNDQ